MGSSVPGACLLDWRRQAGLTRRRTPGGKSLSPPVLFDNLDELRAQYEATLSEYRAKRTHVVNALIMLSFFGGLALALLVTHVGPAANRLGQPALAADGRGNGLLRRRHGRVERAQPHEARRSHGRRVRSLPAAPDAESRGKPRPSRPAPRTCRPTASCEAWPRSSARRRAMRKN